MKVESRNINSVDGWLKKRWTHSNQALCGSNLTRGVQLVDGHLTRLGPVDLDKANPMLPWRGSPWLFLLAVSTPGPWDRVEKDVYATRPWDWKKGGLRRPESPASMQEHHAAARPPLACSPKEETRCRALFEFDHCFITTFQRQGARCRRLGNGFMISSRLNRDLVAAAKRRSVQSCGHLGTVICVTVGNIVSRDCCHHVVRVRPVCAMYNVAWQM